MLERILLSASLPLLLFLPNGIADSITVNDQRHDGVYIQQGEAMYYVLNPADGSQFSIPKASKEITEINISDDESERSALLGQWKAKRSQSSTPSTINNSTASSSQGLHSQGETQTDSDDGLPPPEGRKTSDPYEYVARQRLKDLAEFESTYVLWCRLPEKLRGQFISATHLDAVEDTVRTAEFLRDIESQRIEVSEAQAKNQAKLEAVKDAEKVTVSRAYSGIDLQFYTSMYEVTLVRRNVQDSLGAHNPYTELTLGTYAAKADLALGKANLKANAVRQEAGQIKEQLVNVDLSLEKQARVLAANAGRAEHAYAAHTRLAMNDIAMMSALQHASTKGYKPMLNWTPLLTEEGSEDGESEPFTVKDTLWKIEWGVSSMDFAGSNFRGLIQPADGGSAFTSFASDTPYHKSFLVFDKSGAFKIVTKVKGKITYGFTVYTLDLS